MHKKTFFIILCSSLVILGLKFQFLAPVEKTQKLLTPLELAGLYIYQREGCMHCHSRVIRPLRDELQRYGNHSISSDLAFFKDQKSNHIRIGPDLANVGHKYSDAWLSQHFQNPRSHITISNMPAYPHLNRALNTSNIDSWMQQHDYPKAYIAHALNDIPAQLDPDHEGVEGLTTRYQNPSKNIQIRNFDQQDGIATELDALISFLQTLDTSSEL
ncbi:MAG: cbb3-type cytochrome c oxidase subunit II [Mariprofundaceae bacterium]|nr:cbb3-type cytochrome c oxidase subunit II [Mariprofundaceae bacterium]